MLAGLTVRAVVLFAIVVIGQIAGSVTLGMTAGFTRVGWSLLCAAAYVASLYALALLLKEGAPLSVMMPLLAAVVPIGAMVLAITVLGESASWARLGLLLASCGIVALASTV